MDPLAPLNIHYYSSVDDQYGRVWSHSFAPLQARKRKELELDDEKKHRENHLWREWICRNNTPAAHSQQSPSKKKNRNFEKFPVDQSTTMKTTRFFRFWSRALAHRRVHKAIYYWRHRRQRNTSDSPAITQQSESNLSFRRSEKTRRRRWRWRDRDYEVKWVKKRKMEHTNDSSVEHVEQRHQQPQRIEPATERRNEKFVIVFVVVGVRVRVRVDPTRSVIVALICS